MSSIKTDRAKIANDEAVAGASESIGGVYFPCDEDRVWTVFANGSGFTISEPCSWADGSGRVIGRSGITHFLVEVEEGTRPLQSQTVTGEYSGNTATDGTYNGYQCFSDTAHGIHYAVDAETYPDPTFKTILGISQTEYTNAVDYTPPQSEPFIAFCTMKVEADLDFQSSLLQIGNAPGEHEILLSGRGVILGGDVSGTDATTNLSAPDSVTTPYNATFGIYVDANAGTANFFRYLPEDSQTWWWSDDLTLANFVLPFDTGSQEYGGIASREYRGFGIVFPIRDALTSADLETAISEYHAEAVATTTANERKLFKNFTTGIGSLLPLDFK